MWWDTSVQRFNDVGHLGILQRIDNSNESSAFRLLLRSVARAQSCRRRIFIKRLRTCKHAQDIIAYPHGLIINKLAICLWCIPAHKTSRVDK